jgi:hypothetical protein
VVVGTGGGARRGLLLYLGRRILASGQAIGPRTRDAGPNGTHRNVRASPDVGTGRWVLLELERRILSRLRHRLKGDEMQSSRS